MWNFLYSFLLTLGLIHGAVLGNVVNNAPALFETSLATAMGLSDTSLTLVSASLRDGTTLTGNICLTIDSGLTTTEYVCGSASGTVVSGLTRGIGSDGFTSYPSLKFPHRYGADVKVTDFPALQQLSEYLNGQVGLPNVLVYASGTTNAQVSANGQNLVNYNTLASTSIQGAINADTTHTGLVQIATSTSVQNGVKLGSTGATIVPPASFFNTIAQATNTVPFTSADSSGAYTISPTFISTSSAYTWTGTSTFRGQFNSSSTAYFTTSTFITTSTPSQPTQIPSTFYVQQISPQYLFTSTTSISTGNTFLQFVTSTFTLNYAGRIMFIGNGPMQNNTAADGCQLTVTLDGANISPTVSGAAYSQNSSLSGSVNTIFNMAFSFISSSTSAGTHTVSLNAAASDGGTCVSSNNYIFQGEYIGQ